MVQWAENVTWGREKRRKRDKRKSILMGWKKDLIKEKWS